MAQYPPPVVYESVGRDRRCCRVLRVSQYCVRREMARIWFWLYMDAPISCATEPNRLVVATHGQPAELTAQETIELCFLITFLADLACGLAANAARAVQQTALFLSRRL